MFYGYGIALLLLICLATSVGRHMVHPRSNCDFRSKIGLNQVLSFANPNWPRLYNAETQCRWQFYCPTDYTCRLKCKDVALPQSEGCYVDKILVSRTGNPEFKDGVSFCGGDKIYLRSNGSKIAMALVAGQNTPRGRFRCTVKADP